MSKREQLPNLKLPEEVVASRILKAAHEASQWMTKRKIRHALIGGLAVGAYGYPRATKDVDFLVGEEAFEHHGLFVSFLPGFPLKVDGVSVDILSDEAVEEELDDVAETNGIPIVSPETLIYLKLKAYRRRDREDVVELLKTELIDSTDEIREYLEDVAPKLLERFDELLEIAETEE